MSSYYPQYNPFTNEIDYVPYYEAPEMGAQQPGAAGGGGLMGLAGTVGGGMAGKYAAGKLAGALGIGGAATGAGAVAPIATSAGAIAAPSMSLGALAPMLPGGGAAALGAGSAGAAGAGAAGAAGGVAPTAGIGGMGALGIAAGVASPIILGKLAEKYFMKDRPSRVFNADEVAVDNPNDYNKLNAQVKGYENLGLESRKKLLTALSENKMLSLPGYATEEGQTVKRHSEYVPWGKLMSKPGDKWKEGNLSFAPQSGPGSHGYQPTEEEIGKAYWLKDSAKQRLFNALAAIKDAEGGPLA